MTPSEAWERREFRPHELDDGLENILICSHCLCGFFVDQVDGHMDSTTPRDLFYQGQEEYLPEATASFHYAWFLA